MEIRSCNVPIKLEERAESNTDNNSIGKLTGYIAKFNSDSLDMGGFTEQIRQGAFSQSLRSNDVVALVNHNRNAVVGRLSANTLVLREDSEGLAFDLDLPKTSEGRDLKTLIQRGDVKGCSFGFNIRKEDMSWQKRGKQEICTLEKIDLQEVSVGVTFPAYPATNMSLRSHKSRQESKRNRDIDTLKYLVRA